MYDENAYYDIVIKGHIDKRRISWFEGLEMTSLPNSRTMLSGPIADQAALYSILNKIRDLGMTLLHVNKCSDQ